jgi:hypothetical protein
LELESKSELEETLVSEQRISKTLGNKLKVIELQFEENNISLAKSDKQRLNLKWELDELADRLIFLI